MNILIFCLSLFLSKVNIELIAENFKYPVHLTWQDEMILVVEQGGTVRGVKNKRPGEVWLDIRDRVSSGGEKGLLSIAIGPKNTESENWIFVNYTSKPNGATIISAFPIDEKTNKPKTSEELILLRIEQPWANHNGGYITFGPDNYLYIGMGDGGAGGDPRNYAQNKSSYLGKILRIKPTPNKNDKYEIPKENPFYKTDKSQKEILHWGLRNPWRFSFDKNKKDLWIADVGQNKWEEIHKSPFDKAGINFGWKIMEGEACYEPSKNCLKKGLDIPFHVYDRSVGASITGGYVYRGKAIEKLQGKYIFADYVKKWVAAIDTMHKQSNQQKLELVWPDAKPFEDRVSSFAEDKEGEIYLITHSGIIIKLVP